MEDDPDFKLPQGFSMDEIAIELGIEPTPLPQIGSELTSLNNAVRKNGVGSFAEEVINFQTC